MMAGGIANVASGVQTIDALLGLFRWSNLNLTYNFPTTDAYYNPATYFTDGSVPSGQGFNFSTFGPVTASLQSALSGAITSQLMAVAPLVYTLTTPSNPAADSSFAMADLFVDAELGIAPGGLGYYPGLVDRGGDGWFNITQPRFNDVDIGDSAYLAVLHELGHTVGLKHGHDNDRPGPTTDLLPDELNSFEFSVMTYHRYVGDEAPFNDTEEGSFPQSLMMLDIAAIQYMYGANFNTNSGNTVYTFSTTTGEMFVDGVGQGMPQANRIFRTIWDGNGVDTYDLSNYTTNLEIDLAPGGWSNFNSDQLALLNITNDIHARGNVFNALQYNGDPRSLIENATGGSGNDTIRGNAANNTLIGNAGADDLFGLDGGDALSGGLGADHLDGGNGADLLVGGAGNDQLTGGAGDDVLFGGDPGVLTPDGNDVLIGGAGHDLLDGGTGNDTLNGGVGADDLIGGMGTDFATYANSTAGVVANLGSPAANTGEASGDTYSSIEGLIGSRFNDTLVGNSSDNELRGGNGNDTLRGLGGIDRLVGGNGNDTLVGGGGNDTFAFNKAGFGIDTINDWQDNFLVNDVISFQGMGLTMADLSITYSGGDATISVTGTTDAIVVRNVAVGSLEASDFVF
jgi:serralysin